VFAEIVFSLFFFLRSLPGPLLLSFFSLSSFLFESGRPTLPEAVANLIFYFFSEVPFVMLLIDPLFFFPVTAPYASPSTFFSLTFFPRLLNLCPCDLFLDYFPVFVPPFFLACF